MPKVKISEYSATANSNTDVASINIDEGCAPSGINNAIRAVMGHLKDFQQGTNGDPFNGPVNGTLGATTASTANVTTLTTSSTVTHNGGTANGVAYLNSSKVLTTGSALVFDTSSALGVGTSTPTSTYSARIASLAAAGTTALALDAPTGTNTSINFYYNGAAKWTTQVLTTGEYRWYDFTASSERMRLDTSGNLGIGTTSPVGRVDAAMTTASLTGYALSLGGVEVGSLKSNSSTGEVRIGGTYTNYFPTFYSSGSEKARIDSSGNLIQVPVTTASGALGTSLSASGGTATVNSATYTITMSASAKLFYVYLANGDAALVFTSYLTSSITFIGITPSNIVASASPTSDQFGISKSANSHSIVFKTGSALSSTAASWVLGSLSSIVS
jgi:hypothetical protein